jgi:hypothetical protein
MSKEPEQEQYPTLEEIDPEAEFPSSDELIAGFLMELYDKKREMERSGSSPTEVNSLVQQKLNSFQKTYDNI